MSSTRLPEDLICSLSRFLFACIPPQQTVTQLVDPDHGEELYLVKGSSDNEDSSFQGSPSSTLQSESGLRLPPQALLSDLVENLKLAMPDSHGSNTATPSRQVSRSQNTAGTISTLTDLTNSSFTQPSSAYDPSRSLSELRHAILYGGGEDPASFSSLLPVSPTPYRDGCTLRLEDGSHPSYADTSSSSIEGVAGSIDSQRDDEGGEEPWVTCPSIHSSLEHSDVFTMLKDGSSSPFKLYGLSNLPSGLSTYTHGTPSFYSDRIVADLSNISSVSVGSPRLTAALVSPLRIVPPGDFHAAYSPTTSTPVRDAMRRALAVMIMHRNSPQPRAPGARRREESPWREVPSSPLSRSELVSLPAGEAAARIVAAVKAHEEERSCA